MESTIRDVRALLKAQLREVFEQARDLGNRYLQEVMEANAGKDWSQKNTLQFRVRQRGNALSIEWYQVNWYGRKAQGREARRTYIPKRNNSRRRDAQVFGYRLEDLLRHTSGWDDDLVTAVEREACEYRRQAHYLADMLVTLRRLERLAKVPTQSQDERKEYAS